MASSKSGLPGSIFKRPTFTAIMLYYTRARAHTCKYNIHVYTRTAAVLLLRCRRALRATHANYITAAQHFRTTSWSYFPRIAARRTRLRFSIRTDSSACVFLGTRNRRRRRQVGCGFNFQRIRRPASRSHSAAIRVRRCRRGLRRSPGSR